MKFIFIGGAQRSGTTLVQTLLTNAMGNKKVLPESHLICDLLYLYKRGIKDWPKTKYYFSTQSELKNFVRNSMTKILDLTLAGGGDSAVIVLKDPNFCQFVPEINDLFTNSVFLLCARDPRDIVCSFFDIEMREKELKQQRKQYSDRNISFYCSKIKNSYKSILSLNEYPLTVYYEKIVTRPHQIISEIAEELHLKLNLESLTNMNWTDKEVRHKESWISPLEEKEPTAERVGIYKQRLLEDEIKYVQSKCGFIMKAFNYEFVKFPNKSKWRFIRKLKLK